jgi:ABC-type spermidine/putrescine transport system permease subunit I
MVLKMELSYISQIGTHPGIVERRLMFSPCTLSSALPVCYIYGKSLAIKCEHMLAIVVFPRIAKILILHFHLIIVLTNSERVIKKTTLGKLGPGGLYTHQ